MQADGEGIIVDSVTFMLLDRKRSISASDDAVDLMTRTEIHHTVISFASLMMPAGRLKSATPPRLITSFF